MDFSPEKKDQLKQFFGVENWFDVQDLSETLPYMKDYAFQSKSLYSEKNIRLKKQNAFELMQKSENFDR